MKTETFFAPYVLNWEKIMTTAEHPEILAPRTPRKIRRSIAAVLAPLERIAATSPNLVANHDAKFEVDGEPGLQPDRH